MNSKKAWWLFGRKQQPSNQSNALIPTPDKQDSSASTVPIAGKPQPKNSSNEKTPRRTRPKKKRSGLITVLLLLLIPLLALVYGLYSLGLLAKFVSGGATSNTVTITPASKDLKNTYTISAVTSTPNPSQQQVEARQLSSSSPVQSMTVTATGTGQLPGIQAIGNLTFFNANPQLETVPAGTVLTDASGVQIVTDGAGLIPATTKPPTEGSVTVAAHAVSAGTTGNIPTHDFNNVPCCNIAGVSVQNTAAFAGGQDGSNYTLVQQSDIDGVATPLKASLTQTAQTSLQSQLRSNEQIADQALCTPTITPNHQAGEKATSLTVTVKVTCTAEAYDHQGALSMAESLLKQEAAKNPGPGYALVGNLVTTVTQTTVTDANKGTLSVLIKAEGIWAYQFSDAQKQALTKLIAGKTRHDAQTLLLQQPGVMKADIQGDSASKFPTDPSQISLVLQTIPGVPASTTPTT